MLLNKENLVKMLVEYTKERPISFGTTMYYWSDFVEWLDSRSPTTACSRTPAIELLERIRDRVLTDENYDADEIVREVDAVLKTADVS